MGARARCWGFKAAKQTQESENGVDEKWGGGSWETEGKRLKGKRELEKKKRKEKRKGIKVKTKIWK